MTSPCFGLIRPNQSWAQSSRFWLHVNLMHNKEELCMGSRMSPKQLFTAVRILKGGMSRHFFKILTVGTAKNWVKPPLKTTKEGVNNTATAKASPDGQSWRRLKRIANGFWKHVSLNCLLFVASSGFSRPDATLRRERNHCEHPSASLIEPPSSAMDVWKQV